jgi:hypothetical protein
LNCAAETPAWDEPGRADAAAACPPDRQEEDDDLLTCFQTRSYQSRIEAMGLARIVSGLLRVGKRFST